ncbi:MAG TPA: hypothetical protein VGG66_05145, partial [Rhizomicrobium sp.]
GLVPPHRLKIPQAARTAFHDESDLGSPLSRKPGLVRQTARAAEKKCLKGLGQLQPVRLADACHLAFNKVFDFGPVIAVQGSGFHVPSLDLI